MVCELASIVLFVFLRWGGELDRGWGVFIHHW